MDVQRRENWDNLLSFLAEHCPEDVEFVKDVNGLITHVVRVQDCQCKLMHTMPVPVPVAALSDTPMGRQAHALYTYQFMQQKRHALLQRRRWKLPSCCNRFFFGCSVFLLVVLFSFLANARLAKVQAMSFQHPLDLIYVLLFG